MASTFSKSDFQFTSARLLGIKYNDGGLCVGNGGPTDN